MVPDVLFIDKTKSSNDFYEFLEMFESEFDAIKGTELTPKILIMAHKEAITALGKLVEICEASNDITLVTRKAVFEEVKMKFEERVIELNECI